MIRSARLAKALLLLSFSFIVVYLLGFLTSSHVGPSSQSAAPVVGTLGGEFSVNANGAASYSIPIEVPPGANGVAPDLSIEYDSQTPDGLLGPGFTLTGVSFITRCPASVRLDGFFGAIYFDDRDRFCLDGQRLIKVAGGGGYGAPGSVYHTEKETWTKIVAQGACGSGPCSFAAWNKDGSKLVFGVDSNSSVALPNRLELAAWGIAEISDLNGNTVSVTYEQHHDSLQIHPSQISYTANAAAGLKAKRSVKFIYEARTDALAKYVGGYRFKQEERLREIKTFVDNSLTFAFALTYAYSPGTGRSLLSKIQKCSASGACYPATSFAWQPESNSVNSPNANPHGLLRAKWCTESNATVGWLDFNADGLPDVHCDTPHGVHRILLSKGTKLVSPNASPDGVIRTNWCQSAGMTATWLDFNGDGKGDIACDGTDGTHRVLVSDGTAVHSPNSNADGLVRANWCLGAQARSSWGNFNADGRADLLCSNTNGIQQALVSDGSTVASPNSAGNGIVKTAWCTESGAITFWGDFNGDRLSDEHCSTPSGVQRVLLSNGSLLESPNSDAQGTVQTGWCAGTDHHPGLTDFNGDGLIDSYCTSDAGQHWVMLSTGTDLVSPNSSGDGLIKTGWCAAPGATSGWADFNGDGLDDLTCSETVGRQLVLLSNGSAVRSPNSSGEGVVLASWCNHNDGVSQSADFNGDGLADFTCHDGSGAQFAMVHAAGFPDLLTDITDGLGAKVTITYKPLTDSTIYAKGSKATWPILDVVTPIYVVASRSTDDDRGNSYAFDYAYRGARTDMEARRWLGFETVTTTERADGRMSEVQYLQGYPITGFASSSTVYSKNKVIQARIEQVPIVLTPYPNVNQVLLREESTSTYTGGVADFKSVKTFSYNPFGNMELLADVAGPSPSDSVFVCYKYANNKNLWRLGYVQASKATRTEQGCHDFLATGLPQWNPAIDLRWNETEFDAAMNPSVVKSWDDRNSVWLATRRTFDGVGNTNHLTDPAGNTTAYVYDDDLTFPVKQISPPVSGNQKLTFLLQYNPKFGVIESRTDPNGNQQSQLLDDFGRVAEIRGPDPASSAGTATVTLRKIAYGRDQTGQYSEVRERQTWDDGDPQNWLWTKLYVDGMGRFFRQETRSTHHVAVRTDLLYDPQGREWKKSYPHYAHDTPQWIETRYDDLNRTTAVISPDATAEKFEYLRGELEVRVTTAAGTNEARTTVVTTDPRLNKIKSVSPEQYVSTAEYDQLSQPRKLSRPNGAVTTFEYDSLGRAVASTDADTGNDVWQYGPDGRLRSATDGAGNVTDFEYDSLNRITKRVVQAHGNGPVQVFRFAYDEQTAKNGQGNLTGIKGPQYEEQFSYTRYNLVGTEQLKLDGQTYLDGMDYDAAGRPSSRTFPDGSVERTSYYVNGLVQKIELQEGGSGPFTTYAQWSDYDALGQPGTQVFGNKLTKNFTYYSVQAGLARLHTWTLKRPDGTLLSAASYDWNRHDEITKIAQQKGTAPAVEETFDHNRMGWLKVAKSPWGTFQYDYDSSGNVKLKDGATFNYKLNTNLLASSSAGASFEFDGAGNETRKTLPNADWEYGFDGDGRLARVAINGQTVGVHLYDDGGSRLTRTDGQGNVSSYIAEDFDTFTSGGKTLLTKYVRGGGVMVAAITTEHTSTAFRTLLDRQRDRMQMMLYDPHSFKGFGRWLSAVVRRVLPTSVVGLGERGASLLFLLSGTALVALTLAVMLGIRARKSFLRASSGSPDSSPYRKRHPVYRRIVLPLVFALVSSAMPGRAFAQLGAGEGYPTPGIIYLHGDQIGSTVLVTDPNGKELTRVAYNPYGEINQSGSSGPDNFRPKFTSKEWDSGSELYYYGARYYDPSLGRFLTADPARQFSSPYTYVNNQPQDFIDPTGRQAALIVMIVVGAVIGAYFGGAAVNHTYNPFLWDWKSGRTLAGIFAGAGIGAAGAAVGGLTAEAGVIAGVVGSIAVGAGENAAYTVLGGGSAKEIVEASAFGAAFGAIAGGLGAVGSRVGRAGRLSSETDELELTELGGGADGTSRLSKRGQAEPSEGEVTPEANAQTAGCGSSFPDGTLVAVPDGLIPIEVVRPGAQVLGLTSEDAAPASFKVGEVTARVADDLIAVRAGGVTIEATSRHQFWVETRGWVGAGDLRPGDPLLSADGSTFPVEGIEPVSRSAQVHNFEVEDAHTYFVSPARILVHNPKCPLSQLPPPKSMKSANDKVEWNTKIQNLVAEFGDKIVKYKDPAKGRRLLDLENFAFVENNQQAVVSLNSFGKGSTRPQHFKFADDEFGKMLGMPFDRKATIKGQYQKLMRGTWHHHPYKKSMAFVPTKLHKALGHKGGFNKLF